jgi:diacylglycerol kinase family enzyme
VLTLGGDGTVNEVVNGLLARQAAERGQTTDGTNETAAAEPIASAAELPAVAALPGGSANVFTGALGLPRDPVDATGHILQALATGRERTIGLGNADGRYFTFNSGAGIDAEVVRAVQGLRAHGRPATPSLYVRLALRQFYRQTDRRTPAVWIEPPDGPPQGPAFFSIISNTAPWTYLGGREINANPQADFDTGLDVLALRDMSSFNMLYAVGQMFAAKGGPLRGRGVMSLHDQPSLTLRAERPVAFQIDGEYVGEREVVTLRSIPCALRVVV